MKDALVVDTKVSDVFVQKIRQSISEPIAQAQTSSIYILATCGWLLFVGFWWDGCLSFGDVLVAWRPC